MRSVRESVRIVAALMLLTATRADAQCPDGSAPPCRARVVPKAPVVDSNLVAVIPFRVTTADTLLGEGFAELLALEFTGEGGPRSVDMSTTLAVWRRAGGGLRSPLTQNAAMKVARDLGAGVLCQGTIVGLSGRVTISASLVNAESGRPIGAPTKVVGAADSIEALLGQVASSLLGVTEAGRLTKSPVAMRAYLRGLALWRRGNREAAAAAFEASFAADTMFASAAFQRWLVAAVFTPSPDWAQKTLALKSRLTPRERLLVDASIGSIPDVRTPAERIASLRRAAIQLDSPAAWYLYGDYVYHSGLSIVGPDSVLPIAGRAFERAIALDSLPIGFAHLLYVALRARDTALVRRLGHMRQRLDLEDSWAQRWVIAAALGDATQLARLRRIEPKGNPRDFVGLSLRFGLDSPIPTALLDEGFRLLGDLNPGARDRLTMQRWVTLRARGQPLAAARTVASHSPQQFSWAFDEFSGDARDDGEFMSAFGASPLDASAAEGRRQCVAARLVAQGGRVDSLDIAALRQRTNERCARVLEIWKAFDTNVLMDSALADLDSIVTTPVGFLGFEHRLLARIYEARGDTSRALRAVRFYPRDNVGVWLAPTLRESGKYYLMARDTSNAVRAYRHFLDLRAEGEPPYFAERDSIKALIATLTRRRERED